MFSAATFALARRFDELPFSPAGIGNRLIDAHRDRNPWKPSERVGADTNASWPVWLSMAYWLTDDVSAERVVRELVSAGQRMRRGWADRDTWDLREHLCHTLGAQMLYLADHANGWPDRAGDEETWTSALRQHGRVLVDYSFDGVVRLREKSGPGPGPDIEPALSAALHWVADNIDDLWG